MGIEKELTEIEFLHREYENYHTPYNEELLTFQIVKEGAIGRIDELIRSFTSNGLGHLSDNPLRNRQYLFVAAMTLVTRFAVEGGLETEAAYNMSDLYIQKMDLCTSPDEIVELYRVAAYDFTNKVRNCSKVGKYSKPIQDAINYVYDHLHDEITVDELSSVVHLSPSYFSTLFKKETGQSVATYIRIKRVNAAKAMLQYTDHTYDEISNYLTFSSQSHFTSVFKKATGMTPKEYRMKHYDKIKE